ncbi:hypothetical protein AG1IA_09793 [Rhizoctonia solani AG-1 IA]|uniref:Uncharacterized protein n=1 Tax=Thanatephorus cucumeris (strain AG1-IA) TaxID=983506 RepID=L8WHH6_THACA|nr:hypothetical protein AG1IA_09793 [Rhizoctonia solani AG-1 IA]
MSYEKPRTRPERLSFNLPSQRCLLQLRTRSIQLRMPLETWKRTNQLKKRLGPTACQIPYLPQHTRQSNEKVEKWPNPSSYHGSRRATSRILFIFHPKGQELYERRFGLQKEMEKGGWSIFNYYFIIMGFLVAQSGIDIQDWTRIGIWFISVPTMNRPCASFAFAAGYQRAWGILPVTEARLRSPRNRKAIVRSIPHLLPGPSEMWAWGGDIYTVLGCGEILRYRWGPSYLSTSTPSLSLTMDTKDKTSFEAPEHIDHPSSSQHSVDKDAINHWTPDERARAEKKLVRKLDSRLMPTMILIFIMNYIDVSAIPCILPVIPNSVIANGSYCSSSTWARSGFGALG